MVPDGYYYALPLLGRCRAGGRGLLASAVGLAAVLAGGFFLWFFRDPERTVPDAGGIVVSPADGKVTDVCRDYCGGGSHTRISIFLNVFDVHVNRSPISGRHPRRHATRRANF